MAKKLEEVKWDKFELHRLFESLNGDTDIQKKHINGLGYYVVTSGILNNGILGQTDISSKIFDENTITVDMFGNAFFRNFKYKLVTHARVFSLKPLISIKPEQGIFLANSLKFLSLKYGYENMCSWEKIKNEKIQLPVKNDGSIDFEFMTSFISDLEARQISELEAYLVTTGLSDYVLNSEEEKILEIRKDEIEWKEFKIRDLFEVNSYKKRFDANKVNILEKGHPYVVRTALNNGIRGYLEEDEKFLNDGNTISFGQDTATMFYQEEPYFTGDKIKIIKSKYERFNKLNVLFFVSTMIKSFSSFTWGSSSFNVDIIKKQKINLPVKGKEVDFDFMEILISAIQKIIIKDVVLYSNKKIEATKKLVFK